MAIRVSIFRDAAGGDCTMDGVTSPERGAKTAFVLGVEGPNTDAEALSIGGVVLRLVKRIINGCEYVHAVPANLPRGTQTMFGGNFVYTSDSRLRSVCQYPIPVHDRIEGGR